MSKLRWYGYFYEFLLNFTDGKGIKDSPKHITLHKQAEKKGVKIKG